MAEISRDFEHYAGFTRRMVGSSVGIVNGNDFLEALQKVRCGQEVPIVTVMRTLRIENWLRQLADSKLLRLIARANDDRRVGEEGTARAH